MLSKNECFQHWCGNKSNASKYLDTARCISTYVESATSLEEIKSIAETQFKNLEYMGIIVYTKLFIDEAILQIPDTEPTEKACLSYISTILFGLYDNWKNDTQHNVFALMEHIEKLLEKDIPFTTKKQGKEFIFSLYMVFHLIRLLLKNMTWVTQQFVKAMVNLELIEKKVEAFLKKIEKKNTSFDPLMSEQQDDSERLNPIKTFLRNHYFDVLRKSLWNPNALQAGKKNPVTLSIVERVIRLEEEVIKVSSVISKLLEIREEKMKLEVKFKSISILFAASEENEQKSIGRKYFLDLIASHADPYQCLLDTIKELDRTQFIEKTKQLKITFERSNLASGIMYGMSWITSPFTVLYRTVTPKNMQNTLAATLPATLDSACKEELKEMTKNCLDDLHSQLMKREEAAVTAVTTLSFPAEEALFIYQINNQQLKALHRFNEAIRNAVQTISKLLETVKEKMYDVNNLKKKSQELSELIHTHECYLSFFQPPSTAVKMAEASNLKKQADELAAEYQLIVDEKMSQIQSNPHLDERIKKYIKRYVLAGYPLHEANSNVP